MNFVSLQLIHTCTFLRYLFQMLWDILLVMFLGYQGILGFSTSDLPPHSVNPIRVGWSPWILVAVYIYHWSSLFSHNHLVALSATSVVELITFLFATSVTPSPIRITEWMLHKILKSHFYYLATCLPVPISILLYQLLVFCKLPPCVLPRTQSLPIWEPTSWILRWALYLIWTSFVWCDLGF